MTLEAPPYFLERYGHGTPCKPSLFVSPDAVYFLVPHDVPAPAIQENDLIFGGDWGVRRMFTGSIVARDQDGSLTTGGRPFYFDSSDLQVKQQHRRDLAKHLESEIARMEAEIAKAGRPIPAMAAKIAVYKREKDLIWRRYHECDDQLEHSTAKWVVETAKAEHAGTISREHLDDMEPRGRGKVNNERNSSQPRGGGQKRIDEKAQAAGIAVVAVAARGTSSLCSRCGRPSVFWHAPDRKSGDPNWSVCDGCRSSDRDHASSESIAARGFDAPAAKRGRRRRPCSASIPSIGAAHLTGCPSKSRKSAGASRPAVPSPRRPRCPLTA